MTRINNREFHNFVVNPMQEIQHIPATGRRRIIIAGGGFGGLKLARKMLGKGYQVVIIDRNNFRQFQPLFYQVATAGLEPSAISVPFRKVLQKKKDVHFPIASLLEVDPENDRITTDVGVLKYDLLVIATGAATNFFNMPGAWAHALPMKSVSDAIFIRNTILQNYESALNETDPEKVQFFLNMVIVGGGPTGVELAGNLVRNARGRPMIPLRYRDKGTLATVGHNRAVAELKGISHKGMPAWLLWTFVHLMSIVGVKNRLIIFTNWAWNYFTYDQSLRLLIKPKQRK